MKTSLSSGAAANKQDGSRSTEALRLHGRLGDGSYLVSDTSASAAALQHHYLMKFAAKKVAA